MTTPSLSTSTDWSSWTPGSEAAAVHAQNLDQLLAEAVGSNADWHGRATARGSLLASIEDHRLDKLAGAVADAVARGDSVDALGRTLNDVLDDTTWADMVATTEMNRAMTAASLSTYAAANVQAISWLTAVDNRVCTACYQNEEIGPIPLGGTFPNGDAPPQHPTCRCSLLPELIAASDLGLSGAGVADLDAGDIEAEAEDAGFEEPDVESHNTAGSITNLGGATLSSPGQGGEDDSEE